MVLKASNASDVRDHVRNIVSGMTELKTLGDTYIDDLEAGIYNWAIEFADENDIVKNWTNNRFKNIYMNKAMSVVSNLKPDYLGNTTLFDRLKDKEFKPHDIPFMKPENIFPERWRQVIDSRQKKEQHMFEDKPEAMSDLIICGKCKKKQCVYKEIQIRSCDEPMTLFISCLNCGNRWRQ